MNSVWPVQDTVCRTHSSIMARDKSKKNEQRCGQQITEDDLWEVSDCFSSVKKSLNSMSESVEEQRLKVNCACPFIKFRPRVTSLRSTHKFHSRWKQRRPRYLRTGGHGQGDSISSSPCSDTRWDWEMCGAFHTCATIMVQVSHCYFLTFH